jgi:hypothetical protein
MAEPAHFHCQYKKFTRSKGQSAVQAAAYRLAMKLEDERTGLLHNYTRKAGVTGTLIATPTGINVPGWAHDPVTLWNMVEAAEKTNPRALVMHEWEIALPHMLNPEQRKEAAREMAQFIADRYGCIAMAAFHNPNRKGDQRNHHIHLMFTPRAIGPDGFARTKFRHYSLRAPEAEANGRMTGAEEIVFIKSQWAAIGNRHLERAGFAPSLDHRSYEDQGIDLEPQKHMGPDATAKERRGEHTAKGDFNRAVRDRNKNRQEWARAWEQSRIDITGNTLPDPPARPQKPFAHVAGQAKQDLPAPQFSKAFMTLMENQKQERTSLIRLHMTEKTKLWQAEQEKRREQKKQWALLYRRQRQERETLIAGFGTWRKRLLRKLDFTGRLKEGHRKALEELERRQGIKRAHQGRTYRTALLEPATRLQDKHARELIETDERHLEQRQEMIAREARNRAILDRIKPRDRTHDKDPGRGR